MIGAEIAVARDEAMPSIDELDGELGVEGLELTVAISVGTV